MDISIVICTRNRAERLSGMLEALAAVRSTCVWEVLIVDNASTDATAQVLASASDCGGRLRTAYADKVGLGAAREFGWRHATGDIIAFTDDDCYVAPDYPDAIVRVFQRHPEVDAVGGKILLYDPQDYPITIDERDEPSEQAPFTFVPPGTLQGANLAIRRRALEVVGGVDAELGAGTPYPCEDLDLAAALAWAGMRSRYDPSPRVWHHHGRKEADVPRLMESYDRGRGAYFAKYLLRPASRWHYVRGWIDCTLCNPYRAGLAQLFREMKSGMRYVASRRRLLPLVAYGLFCLGFGTFFVGYVAASRIVRIKEAAA